MRVDFVLLSGISGMKQVGPFGSSGGKSYASGNERYTWVNSLQVHFTSAHSYHTVLCLCLKVVLSQFYEGGSVTSCRFESSTGLST